MIVAGKCPPEKKELEETEKKGFENIELFIERKHLDSMDKTLKNLRESSLKTVSVHTPHVTLEEDEYLKKADRLAEELNAYLVFHTGKYVHSEYEQVEELDFKSEHGYENQPGASIRCLENCVLNRDHELVLDVAHLYIAEENYLERTKYLLENYQEKIELIHMCDSTEINDGIAFGEGDLDTEELSKLIKSNFNGIVVLEVMPEDQEEALKKWQSYQT
ncbi:MAG: sugar phosphate isomerase/epimerase [Nanohaloarchaea archaeon]|nr:sugar phosphate isomerase/epimerase [Candidatus Nanohaloarchaea archaeon]